MEVIKKTIKRALTVSGVTDTEFVIIPDLNVFYNFKISLTSQVHDIGFFDAFVENGENNLGDNIEVNDL
ncbi:MAG: hypothetical protein ACOC22_00255 [bacterium]